MGESFITKNVNAVLVVLLFILLLVLMGGAIFFQGHFQSITNDMARQKALLANTNQSLDICTQRYDSAVRDLNRTINLTEQEKHDLRQVYSFTKEGLGGTIAQLNSTLLVTENNLALTQSQLADKTKALSTLETIAESRQGQITNLTRRYNSCDSERDRWKNDNKELCNICGPPCAGSLCTQ
ncbi:MAG: hypothetical protein V1735_07410 [Nanoarchaeota archaeon]